jgi:EmrB/QacA subfamily drug resistance transporter
MEQLDGTIVTTSAPRIGSALHVASTDIGLVVTAYLMTLAALIPLSGWLVSRFGTRRVLLVAIAIFTTASLLCAMSTSLDELVCMRILQGIGGAMMVPVGRLAVLGTAPKSEIIKLVAYIVWPALVAPVIAPLAGGLITTYASWRWLFLINVPLGAIALSAAARLVPRVSAARSAPPLDWTGLILTCTSLGGLTYTAHLLSLTGESWLSVGIVGGLTGVSVAAAIRHLLHESAPLINLRTLRARSFRSSIIGGTMFRIAMSAVPFLLPLLFESVFGWSPVKAGAVVLALFVGNIGIKPATTGLLQRFGFRTTLLIATGGLAATLAATATLTAATPLAVIVLVSAVGGVARSIGATAYTTLGFSDIPEAEMPDANGLAATAQQLATAFGVAAATVVLRIGHSLSKPLFSDTRLSTSYSIAFATLAMLALVAAAGATRLGPEVGNDLRRRRNSLKAAPARPRT